MKKKKGRRRRRRGWRNLKSLKDSEASKGGRKKDSVTSKWSHSENRRKTTPGRGSLEIIRDNTGLTLLTRVGMGLGPEYSHGFVAKGPRHVNPDGRLFQKFLSIFQH
ncbi:hypothetical protein RRG08_008557 [Elysia crispata]|uniref:Uncharacterized protein n=1 Tax=Elysia crispata TaxID=231223 RepID=A0AAE0YN13_9GAST|nr:hypothetical protein RRG08_008557 [Elysia crispata]